MMKVRVQEYIAGVDAIYAEQPKYEEGHDGSDGYCDCIGMCRGGLKRAGVTGITNMRGTNQAARKTIQELKQIGSVSLGDVVLKTRDKDDAKMPLPDRYRRGGSDYDPDIGEINFTHIGTVTNENPIEITHMTSPTAKKDKSLKGWSYSGRLPWVEDETMPEEKNAVVFAPTGNTVNMRKAPNIKSALVERVPIGETVELLQAGDEWCNIRWKQYKGYMMARFLLFDGACLCTVTIPGLTIDQANALIAEYPDGYITAG